MSLGASGIIWELLDQNPRVAKSQSLLDRRSGIQVHLDAPGSAADKSGNADDKPGSAGDKIGSTSNHCSVQSGGNNIFIGNTAGASGNHSHYLSFNNF